MKTLSLEDESFPELVLATKLLHQFFGKRVYGNFWIGSDLVGFAQRTQLGLIARADLFYVFSRNAKLIGALGEPFETRADGSVIAVYPEYKKQAKEYAKEYERITGRNSLVVLSKDFSDNAINKIPFVCYDKDTFI